MGDTAKFVEPSVLSRLLDIRRVAERSMRSTGTIDDHRQAIGTIHEEVMLLIGIVAARMPEEDVRRDRRAFRQAMEAEPRATDG